MEPFHATVDELSRVIEQRRRELRERAGAEERAIQALRALAAKLEEQSEAFDADDLKAVQREIARREEASAALRREEERQEGLRRQKETLMLKLNRTLQLRSQVLDEADAETKVLSHHEELLRFFAEKQIALTQLLNDRMRELVEVGATGAAGGVPPSK